jgi:tetratricopeptide (TPR) repeat protein
MKIAIYAIAKNEAKVAQRFAASCKAADRVVVLDTGSTDQTVERLRKHGVEVHQATIDPWRFDSARNRALDLLPPDTDVCLKMDLDECPMPGWREVLEAAWVPGVTTQAWYTFTWSWKAPGLPQQRFLQNQCHARQNFTWRHRCHEALYFTGTNPQEIQVPAMHVEHHPDLTKSRASYLPLMEAEHQAEPSTRSRFYLGREYYFCGRFAEAIALFHEYLQQSTYCDERGVACWYLYMMTGKGQWARRAAAESPTQQHLLAAAQAALKDKDSLAGLRMCEMAIAAPKRLAFGDEAVADPEVFDTAASCAWDTGQQPAAFQYLERASQLEPRRDRAEKYASWMRSVTYNETPSRGASPRVCILTMETPEISDHCSEMSANKLAYARHCGHDFMCLAKPLLPNLPPQFSKIAAINQQLTAGLYDQVWWVDMDCVFTDFRYDLAELLQSDRWLAALNESNAMPNICSGLMLIRSCAESREFFQAVAEDVARQPSQQHPFDQLHINRVLAERNSWSGVQLCTVDEMGAFSEEIWSCHRPWRQGDRTLHLAGSHASWALRRQVFVERYQHLVLV